MGPPNPLPPGPDRPPVPPSGCGPPPSFMPNCPQCPVHIIKILELQDRNKANVHASEEDKNELRTYIAHEQSK
eukprot:1281375-Heterocapsa_arctica.AAC.1